MRGHLFKNYLVQAQEDGMVSAATIDRAVSDVLRTRFRLGMFDPPEMVPYSKISSDAIGSPAHELLALRIAQDSLVLLKNTPYEGNPLLPLNRKTMKSIAVVGPYAAVAELGDYSGVPIHTPVAPLDGIRTEAGAAPSVRYVPYSKPVPGQASATSQPFAREADAARSSDVAIAFLGFATESGREGKDRDNLDLPTDQQELI